MTFNLKSVAAGAVAVQAIKTDSIPDGPPGSTICLRPLTISNSGVSGCETFDLNGINACDCKKATSIKVDKNFRGDLDLPEYLPFIQRVFRDFKMDGTRARSLTNPNPLEVGGKLDINMNPVLTNVEFASFSGTTNDININGNDKLEDAIFNSVRSVGSNVAVTNNDRLEDLQMPSVGSIGGSLDISGNKALKTASFNTLNTIGDDFSAIDNNDLTRIELPNLKEAGGFVDVHDNAKMEAMNFFDIQEIKGDVRVNNNAAMGQVTMSNLREVDGDINLDNNPELKSVSLGSIKVRDDQKCSICTNNTPNQLNTFIPWDAVEQCTTECPGGETASLTAASTEPTCWETNVKCVEKCRAVGLDVFRSECYGADDNRCLICSCLKNDGLGGNIDFTRFMPLDCTSPYCGYAEQGQSNACPVAAATQ